MQPSRCVICERPVLRDGLCWLHIEPVGDPYGDEEIDWPARSTYKVETWAEAAGLWAWRLVIEADGSVVASGKGYGSQVLAWMAAKKEERKVSPPPPCVDEDEDDILSRCDTCGERPADCECPIHGGGLRPSQHDRARRRYRRR